MVRTRGQSDQDVHESSLPKLKLPARSEQLAIFDGIDQNFDSPLRAFESDPADAFLNIAPQEFVRANGVGQSVAPINDVVPSFVQSTINFQTLATAGGTFDIVFPASTVGQFRRMGLTLLGSGTIKAVFSAENAVLASVANPGTLFVNGVGLLWLDLECTDVSGKFKTAGSATDIIENKVGADSRIHAFAGGGANLSAVFDEDTIVVDDITGNVLTADGNVLINA